MNFANWKTVFEFFESQRTSSDIRPPDEFGTNIENYVDNESWQVQAYQLLPGLDTPTNVRSHGMCVGEPSGSRLDNLPEIILLYFSTMPKNEYF